MVVLSGLESAHENRASCKENVTNQPFIRTIHFLPTSVHLHTGFLCHLGLTWELWDSQCLPSSTFSTARLVLSDVPEGYWNLLPKGFTHLGTYIRPKANVFVSSFEYCFTDFSSVEQYLRCL